MKAITQDSGPRVLTAAAALLAVAALLTGAGGSTSGMLEGKKPVKTAPVEETEGVVIDEQTEDFVIDEGKLLPGHQVGTPEFENPFPTT